MSLPTVNRVNRIRLWVICFVEHASRTGYIIHHTFLVFTKDQMVFSQKAQQIVRSIDFSVAITIRVVKRNAQNHLILKRQPNKDVSGPLD